MNSPTRIGRLSAVAIASLALLSACGGGDDNPVPEEARAQDTRTFTARQRRRDHLRRDGRAAGDTVDMSTTSRWAGVLDGAAYRVEVPANWNGKLVMYAHGYAGTGAALSVAQPVDPPLPDPERLCLGGVELQQELLRRARRRRGHQRAGARVQQRSPPTNGRALAAPTKYFITGHSMGGHITAAAIEDEAAATAVHKVKYNGAVPMCGVVGDTELFNEFAGDAGQRAGAGRRAGLPDQQVADIQRAGDERAVSTFNTTPSFPTPSIVPTAGRGHEVRVGAAEHHRRRRGRCSRRASPTAQSFPSAYGTFGGDGTQSPAS